MKSHHLVRLDWLQSLQDIHVFLKGRYPGGPGIWRKPPSNPRQQNPEFLRELLLEDLENSTFPIAPTMILTCFYQPENERIPSLRRDHWK